MVYTANQLMAFYFQEPMVVTFDPDKVRPLFPAVFIQVRIQPRVVLSVA
jgi:hypothetical protein